MGFINDLIDILYELEEVERWRVAGFVSSVVGLLCNALSPSFKRLIGGWDSSKFLLYLEMVIVILATIYFAKEGQLLENNKLKVRVTFVVLMLTSAYSFLCDKAKSEKPDVLSMVSNAAFALISLSLSKLLKLGFEAGMFAFFLGSLAIQLMTIHFTLIIIAIIYGYPLFLIHSNSSESDEPLQRRVSSRPMLGADRAPTSRGRRRVTPRGRGNQDAQTDTEMPILSEIRVD